MKYPGEQEQPDTADQLENQADHTGPIAGQGARGQSGLLNAPAGRIHGMSEIDPAMGAESIMSRKV